VILGADLPVNANGFAAGVIAVARQIAADKSPAFETHLFTAYGIAPQPYLNIVDPDEVDPYLTAWVNWAVANKHTGYSASKAKAAMVAAGLDEVRSVAVANAVLRARANGLLDSAEILDPFTAAKTPGILTRVGQVVEDVAASVGEGARKAGAVIEWTPIILAGLAVGALVFVSYPYLTTARAPARRLRR
jgi:hypothetical protein